MSRSTQASLRRAAHPRCALVLACVAALSGCFEAQPEPPQLPRTSRFGALRDLEYFPRSSGFGGPFFFDRFEVTRADWEAWRAQRGDPAPRSLEADPWNTGRDPALPQVGVSLADAREFARWRFGRVPRFDEWSHVATGGGSYALPWGDALRPTWANTEELGLLGLTPVGAFESGRPADGPYDLVGNAGEWTETPAWQRPDLIESFLATGVGPGDLGVQVRTVAQLQVTRYLPRVPAVPWPLGVLVAAHDDQVPRLVIAGFTRPLAPAVEHFWSAEWRVEVRAPRELSSVIGMRVASDPDTLVELLTADGESLTTAEERALRAFLARPGIRDAVRNALQRRSDWRSRSGQVTAVLLSELGL